MVQEVTSESDFRSITRSGKLVVVDFTASWCGPCRKAAPIFEQLAGKYTDVTFIKVTDDNAKDLIISEGIRAFPTFRLYHNGQILEEIQGGDMGRVDSAIIQHRGSVQPSFQGSGVSLGGSGAANSSDAREARLRRLGLPVDPPAPARAPAPTPAPSSSLASGGGGIAPPPLMPAPPTAASASSPTPPEPPADTEPTAMDIEDAEDEALLAEALKARAAKPSTGESAGAVGDNVQMVEPPVDETLLAQLLEFGFTEVRSKKGLLNGGGNIEGAVNWLTEHQEDPDIDDPIPLVPQLDMSSMPGAKRKLTVEELQERIAARRKERAEADKAADIAREKARRESGKNIGKTKEELDRIQRRREAEQIKREKEAYRLERERLRAEIAKDKAERAARQGVLPGRLDADGYNPSGLQGAYGSGPATGVTGTGGGGAATTATAAAKAPTEEGTPSERLDKYIGIISRQRIAGSGGTCLKTLLAYIKNIADNPAEDKFRSINLSNNAFKDRVAPVVGSTGFLRAVGFEKDDVAGRWYLAGDKVDVGLLTETRGKLEAAYQAYSAS